MSVPVVWWSHNPEANAHRQWDSGVLQWLFSSVLWPIDFTFTDEHPPAGAPSYSISSASPSPVAVVVVPARHNAYPEAVVALNEQLALFTGVVLVLIGDEEGVFPWKDVRHDRIRFWVMSPHPVHHADMAPWAFFFGTGMKVDTREILASMEREKVVPWAFAGQVTHPLRKQAVNGLRKAATRVAGQLIESESFTAGLPRQQYLELLAETKIAPCPSGPLTADTMRLYEALQAGCLPIVDAGYGGRDVWQMMYPGGVPFWVTHDWESIGGWIEAELDQWPGNVNLATAWWVQRKREMAKRMQADLVAVGAVPDRTDRRMTVIVTASPIPSHPGIEILSETLTSLSDWGDSLRGSELILAFDGVRPEQADMRAAYEEHVRRMCAIANLSYNTVTVVSKHHRHQANMIREALEYVDTPTVLIMEHDTPLVTDCPIDWKACVDLVDWGGVDVLRFYHEAHIQPEHEHLMLDPFPVEMLGVPLRRTKQWSQRPHLANTNYYRRILTDHFPITGSAFVEDRMHSIAQADYKHHRLAIYHPKGNIERSVHLDGRAGGEKYTDKQRF